jgi:hypothetical protein
LQPVNNNTRRTNCLHVTHELSKCVSKTNDLLFIIFIVKRLWIYIYFFFAFRAKTEVLKNAFRRSTSRFVLGMLSNNLLTRARRRRDVYFKNFSTLFSLHGHLQKIYLCIPKNIATKWSRYLFCNYYWPGLDNIHVHFITLYSK